MTQTFMPRTGAPEWQSGMKSPWDTVGKAFRIHDTFTVKAIVASRSVSAPPGSVSDGTAYLVPAGATADWYGEDGRLAIAVGTDAANGWYFCDIGLAGAELYVEDEAKYIEYFGGAWQFRSDQVQTIGDLSDVDLTGLLDGDVLQYDASQMKFYVARPYSDLTSPIVEISGTSAILDPDQANFYHRFTSEAAKTFTINPDSATPLVNAEWHGRNVGTANLTIVEGSGVTINVPSGGTLVIPQGGTFTLKRITTDLFDLLGQTVAA